MSVTQYFEDKGACPARTTQREYWIAGLALASGATLGALAMYLCDPNRGKSRRTKLREQAIRKGKHLAEDFGGRIENLADRAKGAFARAGAAVQCQSLDDEVLAARVRSHIGHVSRHAHRVQTDVQNGIVIVTGTLPVEERSSVMSAVREVPGVLGVEDRLTNPAAV